MESLLPIAKKLATNIPMAMFKHILDQESPGAYEDNRKLMGHTFEFFAGSICDLNAMAMMVIAAGVDRLEAMKKAVNGRKPFDNRKENGFDHAHVLGKTESGKFTDIVNEWCGLVGNGAIQFKFDPDAYWHTFVAERIRAKQEERPQFRIYQAYQGTYRLVDFLGLAKDDAARKYLEKTYAKKYELRSNEPQKIQYWQNSRDKYVKKIREHVPSLVEHIGKAQLLSETAFKQYVVNPLKVLLSGKLAVKEYTKLTGDPPGHMDPSASTMVLFVCDQITPDSFSGNYKAIESPPKQMTPYATPVPLRE